MLPNQQQGEVNMATDATHHHRKAAEYFESAAKHHADAAEHFGAGRHEQAASAAYLGHGDYLHARNHAAEAARLHTRHTGARRESGSAVAVRVSSSSGSASGPALLGRPRTERKPS